MAAEAPAEPAKAPEPAKGGLPVKTIAVVLVLLVLEAVGVVAFLTMFGKPSEVKGVGLEEDHHAETDQLVEIPVVSEKFTNSSSGRVWVWNTEIVAVVKKKNAGEPEPAQPAKKGGGHGEGGGGAGGGGGGEGHSAALTVREELKAKMAKVRTGIGAIFSSAQHSYFTEPGRETLSRQILVFLREVFGQDAEGHERIESVLIPNCLGFPADY